jgi:carbon-monoxide dehydrogenase medium subunit
VKPAPFEYHAPESIGDAVALLAAHGDDAKPLAGGQSLVPMLALRLTRFEHLVDLNRVADLQGVRRDNGSLRVGAMTRQVVMERESIVAESVPLLARATPLIGHFQIRNRGTVGGSLAHADPASEYPAVAAALGAEFELTGRDGVRRVPASEFFLGTWTTCIEPDELLTAVRFPVWDGRCGFAVEEMARRLGDFALVGVACAVQLDGSGSVARAGIGLFGVDSTPVRAAAAEDALVAGASPDDVGLAAVADLSPPDDVHASGTYRTTVGARLVARAVRNAINEAGHE